MPKRLHLPPLWLCVLIGICVAYFYMRGVTGIYVGQGPNLAILLNVVESWDGHISGQYQEVALNDDGNLNTRVFAVSGAANTGNISFSIKENELLSQTLTMSGTYNGFSINLTFLGKDNTPTSDSLNRSTLQVFQTLLSTMKEKSQKILADRESAKEQAAKEEREEEVHLQVENLVSELQAANKQFDTILSKPTTSDKKYRDITQKMQAYLDDMQNIQGNNVEFRRGQVLYAMNKGTFASDQIHFKVESGLGTFSRISLALLKAEKEAQNNCYEYKDVAALSSECTQLNMVGKEFHEKGKQVEERFKDLETSYQSEYKIQKALIAEAQQIQ